MALFKNIFVRNQNKKKMMLNLNNFLIFNNRQFETFFFNSDIQKKIFFFIQNVI